MALGSNAGWSGLRGLDARARLFLSISPEGLGDRFSGLLRFTVEHGFVLEHRVEDLNMYPLASTLYAVSRSFSPRIQNEPWATAVELAVHTDLLVFRYEGESRQLWPQAHRELRRGIRVQRNLWRAQER